MGLSENRNAPNSQGLSSDFPIKMAITLVLMESLVLIHPNKFIQENPGWIIIIIIITKPKLTQTYPNLPKLFLCCFTTKMAKDQLAAWPSDCHLAAADPRFPGCRADCPWSPAQLAALARVFSGNLGMFLGKCWELLGNLGKVGPDFWEILGNSRIHANSQKNPQNFPRKMDVIWSCWRL